MKSTQGQHYLIAIQLVLLGACNLPPKAIVPPVLPSQANATPMLQTIDLAGPKMEIGSTFLHADGALLVPVPSGSFTMGADGPDSPKHKVHLSDFWIYSTKVTNNQYSYCVAVGQCTPLQFQANNPAYDDPLHANDPMVGVNYNQAVAYCSFAHARLPTEAEWEKAARGPEGNIYPWGDGAPSCELLNYGTCVGSPTSVTKYPGGRSYYHAFDMEGNTLEWVADWYQADYYFNAAVDNPQGPDKGTQRSVRSSAFNSGGNQTQTFNRTYASPDTQRNNLGFRCVVNMDHATDFAPFCNYPAVYGTDGIGGATTGPQSAIDCPDLSIEQSPYCQGTTPKTIVELKLSFNKPLYSLTYSLPGSCQPIGYGDLKQDCTGTTSGSPGNVVFCSYCNVTVSSEPQCPDQYSYDATKKTCQANINPASQAGACLPGYALDPTNQCCTFAPPALPEPTKTKNSMCEYTLDKHGISCQPLFPSCPAGTSFDGQECISTEHPQFCISEPIQFKSCTRINTGGGAAQGCPVQSCSVNYKWDPNVCACVCDTC